MYLDNMQMRTLWPSRRDKEPIAEDVEGFDCDGDPYTVNLRLSSDGKWVRASSESGHFHVEIKTLKKSLKSLKKKYDTATLPQVDVEEPS